ncbi:platelet-activating factor acetylhydrolase, isoform II domain-containing protein [Sarocladium implicatum]|nr:platelet-activating factor acetylhydrolase, isoform II domain-containing protein [Sarocladium implicatum]
MPPPNEIHELESVASDDARLSTDSSQLPPDADMRHLSPSPDSPLLTPTLSTQPAWLTTRSRRLPPWLSRLFTRITTLIRPRFTWRYLLCATLALYASWCLVTGSHLLASKLPDYSGPHRVGAIDLEVPLEKPQLVSNTTLKGTDEKPAFELETVLFTLYYPIDDGVHSKKPRHLWFPRPISLTAEGYATLAHANNFIVRPIFTFFLWAVAGSITIPAAVDVPLLSPPSSPSRNEDSGRLPLMVFSHGMASSRTDYTHYLGEIASRGYIVAAIEHRDGSCPGSIINHPSKPPRRVLPLRQDDLVSDPPMDQPRLKRDQLAFRTAEIFETINALRTLDAADSPLVTTRSEGQHLDSFAHRLDFSHLTIAGHSYGATGALQALHNASSPASPIPPTGGIALDPGKSSGPLNTAISLPLLLVHSNSWSRTHSLFFGRPHFDTVRDLARLVLQRTGAAWFLTSKGTSHPSVTDAPLLEPLLLSWTTGATVDVKQGLQEYVKISLDFMTYLRENKTQGLLAEKVTHEEYDKWVSEERKKEFPKDVAKYWQIHVSPASGQ